MAPQCCQGDPALHRFRVPEIYQPLHNSIPPELVHRLDPVYVEYYNRFNLGRIHTHEVPIEEYRKNPARYTISYGRAPGPDIFRITEQKCPTEDDEEITIRIFEPPPKMDGQGRMKKRAAYINFHGGGWVFGGLDVDHDFCKWLVHELDGELVVFDVDYRLAPEYQYPIPVDDCWTAFNWIRDEKAAEFNLDTERFAVGGASAGGHLAAIVALHCMGTETPLALQILTVPVCDLHSVFTPEGEFDRENCPYDSYREMEFAPALPAARMAYFHRQFLGVPRPEPSDFDWKISPMIVAGADLAPALISTAEVDPLRDEGELYAAKLKEAGTRVELIRYTGAPHIFPLLDGILESGRQHRAMVVAALKQELLQPGMNE